MYMTAHSRDSTQRFSASFMSNASFQTLEKLTPNIIMPQAPTAKANSFLGHAIFSLSLNPVQVNWDGHSQETLTFFGISDDNFSPL